MTDPSPSRPDDEQPSVSIEWPPIRYWVRIGFVLIGVTVLLRLVIHLQTILLIVAASFVLGLGLQPAILWFEQRGMRRGLALTTVIAIGGVVFAGFLVAVVPALIAQVGEAADQLPGLLEQMRNEPGPLGEMAGRIDPGAILDVDGARTLATLGSAASAVLNLLTVGVLMPYFAYAFPDIRRFALRLIGREDRPDALRVINESVDRISGFVAGNLFVSLVAFGASFVAFRLLGIEYALALAAWVGFTDLIPVVGALFGSLAVVIVSASQGTEMVVAAVIFLLLYQQFENYVIVPRVMKRTVDLSPPAVIVAFLAGGALAGIAGALLALPITAVLKLVFIHFVVEPRMERARVGLAASPTPTERRGDTFG